MRGTRVWARLLGLQRSVVEDAQIGTEEELIVCVRPGWREGDRCGICRRRSPGFDLGQGRRRWRAMDLGTTLAFVEAAAPLVRVAVVEPHLGRGAGSGAAALRTLRLPSPQFQAR